MATFARERLTARECEVLELVAHGKNNKEIALLLCISQHTVKHHMTHVLEKLQVANRAEASVAWVVDSA